jgi:imidazolonepropionase
MTGPSRDGGALVAPRVITAGDAPLPRRGDDLGRPGVIRDGALAWEDGALTYVGPASGLEARAPMRLPDDVTVVPGFVDAHTHLPFFGWRADEFEARLAGRSYRDLHADGGIPRSARLLAEASDEQVLAFCLPLVREMLDAGTTALEFKTGYGLSVDAELRQARLARRLGELAPQTCTVTLLACHAVPEDMDRPRWVRLACEELIPAASAEGLADAVDIYVEDIAFDLADLEAVATAARLAGLPLRVHADQLGPSGAARRAAQLGARTADHLNHADAEGVRALGSGSTLALLLPASTFLMRGRVPPARELVDAGAPIGIATDFNPGTSPVLSMPEAIAIGCALYGMTPYEALTASTANAAWALGLDDKLGTLEVGKRADFLCLEGDDFRHVPYRPGHDPVLHTFVAGARVGGR